MNDKRKIIAIFIIVAIVAAFAAVATFFVIKSAKNEAKGSSQMTETATEDSSDKEDPQHTGDNAGSMSVTTDEGASADETQILSASTVAENSNLTFGIDVSKYQGTIKWDKVAAGGIDFAMIRVGYRTQKTGEMCVDTNARYNMQEAQKNGIKVGVYFFSSAVNETEAIEEADWVADYISKYQITYPVAFDCEGFTDSASRQYGMSSEARTKVAEAFLQEIYNKGYTPMFYAAMNELSANSQWDTKTLESRYKIWVSQYPDTAYPETPQSSYEGTHAMWQYTNKGKVSGIDKPVDLNVAYFGFDETESAKNGDAADDATADPEANMKFSDVSARIGKDVFITNSTGWQSPVFRAAIQPLRYKNKMYLGGVYTEIGKAKYDYFLYIGPPDHDISRLSADSRIIDSSGRGFTVDHCETVYYKNTPFYIWAIVRETNGI